MPPGYAASDSCAHGLAASRSAAVRLDERVREPPTASSRAFTPLVVVGDRAAYLHAGLSRAGLARDVLAAAVEIERLEHPRWAVQSAESALRVFVTAGVRVARAWDLAEVHRLLAGGWAADLGRVHAHLVGLPIDRVPQPRASDLFDFAAPSPPDADPNDPVGAGGYVRADALTPDWADRDERLLALARLVGDLAARQYAALSALPVGGPRAVATAHSESAAAVLCLELAHHGLPVDRRRAEHLIGAAAGPRPASELDAARIRRERDSLVLRHTPDRSADLRNPAQVKALLAGCGVEVETTRKWVLEPYRTTHPVVGALLDWRKAERIATTYGYRWLDEHVGPDDRLRGAWTACDGGAGRMTAQAGLHNLPAELRPAVAAAAGHVFVRADLGQIEPRVLAAVSGDPAFAAATRSDDLYAPVAAKLGVERPVAKVAVLAAMYGQRSGSAGEALRDLQRAYPVAMRLLDDAYAAGLARRPLRTFGGRLIPLDRTLTADEQAAPREWLDAARGRFARNAIIQGAAERMCGSATS